MLEADEIDGGDNDNDDNNSNNHSNDDDDGQRTPLPPVSTDMATDPTPTPPCRPPQPTLLDDLLARFPYEQDAARDIWFPLLNSETSRWELGVVMGPRRVSSCPQQYDIGRPRTVVVVAPEEMGEVEEEEDKTGTTVAFSINEDEVDYTPLTPSNTLVDIVVKKSKKRNSSRKKNGRPPGYVLDIPELYVNARPYEEIEAEEARAAALAATVESDERIEVDAEEEEALTALAARDTREASNFLSLHAIVTRL